MKTIEGKILEERLNYLGVDKKDFAFKMGVSQSAVSNWLIRGIPKDKVNNACSILMIDFDFTTDREDEDEQYIDTISIPKLRNITVSAGAGFSIDCVDEDIYDGVLTIDSKDLLRSNKLASLIAVRVDGRSMSPTLNHNEWVIIDKDKKHYIGDNLYVVNYAGNLLVKRLQYDPSLNSIEIISDNPSYKSYKVNLSEDQQYFQIIGIVVTILTGC